MASEKPVDASQLAILRAKHTALGRLIEAYEEVERIGALGGPFDQADLTAQSMAGAASKSSIDLPVGVFRDKSLKDAIQIYLGAGRRKQTNKEIAVGLQAGGFPTTAENFEATVATALYRLKNEGTILRFPDGWDLAASYPDNLRSRLEKDSTPRKAKVRGSRLRRAGRAKAKAKATKQSEAAPATSAKTTKVPRKKPDTAPRPVEPHLKAV